MSSFRNAEGGPAPAPAPSGPLSIERVVAILTPLFAAAGGWVSAEIAKLVNVSIPASDFTAIFITGAVAAAAAAIKWLHGRSQYVNVKAELEAADKRMDTSRYLSSAIGAAPVKDIESLLAAHEANIVQAVGGQLGAGPVAENIANQIVRQLWPSHAGERATAVAGSAATGQAPTPGQPS